MKKEYYFFDFFKNKKKKEPRYVDHWRYAAGATPEAVGKAASMERSGVPPLKIEEFLKNNQRPKEYTWVDKFIVERLFFNCNYEKKLFKKCTKKQKNEIPSHAAFLQWEKDRIAWAKLLEEAEEEDTEAESIEEDIKDMEFFQKRILKKYGWTEAEALEAFDYFYKRK